MKLKFFLLTMVALFFAQGVKANGLQATNISLQGQNITNQTWQVRFNLTWNNSWRDGINYDAAWIFIKYRIGNGPWTHARLNTTGNTTGTGTAAELRVSPDNMGAIINRQLDGAGTFSVTAMELQWNYGITGVQNNDLPQVRVFAIEMVQIPEGPFAIGDGDGGSESTHALGVADNRYYVVTRELSPPVRADGTFSNGNNILRIKGDGGVDNNGDAVIDNANYPVGYNAFFMMKYNITQEQYADFLSTLLPLQAAPRFQGAPGFRFTIQSSGGLFFTNRPDRICNFMSSTDGLAYSDWAGLRPFTETEFEKACRGPLAPVNGEYAWGSTSFSPSYASTTLNNSTRIYISGTEDGTETTTNTANNAHWWGYFDSGNTGAINGGDGNIAGPLRAGIFVESSAGTRESGGLSYYGVVDLSGNISEQMYNITSTSGRQFTGNHGDGQIDANGNANVNGWPTSGLGYKGFAAAANITFNNYYNFDSRSRSRVSDRGNMESTLSSRYNHGGFRCARSQWW
jgi:formylglycine-generating enzyme required for sulfatase activity